MKKYVIILISAICLTFAMGAISAEGITDFNAPLDFDRGAVTFTYDDFEMEMQSYSDFIDYEDYFKNHEDYKVKINDTRAEYQDKLHETVGVLEIVKIDGDENLVICSFDELDKSKIDDCHKYMDEFNDLNKFKPIKIKNK